MAMKLAWTWGLVAASLPACVAVDTPATDTANVPAEQALASDLDSWCDATCARVGHCSRSCACRGEGCECVDASACPEDCRGAMQEFLGEGDDCALVGRDFMACVDRIATCEDLERGRDCELSARQEAACTGGDDAAPTAAPGGVSCRGISGGGTAGAAGGANAPAFSCRELREECSDGARYQFVCDGSAGSATCNCFRNGEFAGTFSMTPARCPSAAELNAGCGWFLAD
jgi:hypothetical protein